MNPEAMAPYGMALQAYEGGDSGAELIIRREDGREAPLPVSYFFRAPSSPMDQAALVRCSGHVLDIGAGTGPHSLLLRQKGLAVTSIDVDPRAVRIMRRRGLEDVHCADIFEFRGRGFDTILMLGHGIGIVETIAGLDRFLHHAHGLLSGQGRILMDSLDVRVTEDPTDLAYQEFNKRAGRYRGEIRMQFEFQGKTGPWCGWLHVDAETLGDHARQAGWHYEVVHQEENGNYLAQLSKIRREE